MQFTQRANELLADNPIEVVARKGPGPQTSKNTGVRWQEMGSTHHSIANHLRQQIVQDLQHKGLPASAIKNHALYHDLLLHRKLSQRYHKAAQFSRMANSPAHKYKG